MRILSIAAVVVLLLTSSAFAQVTPNIDKGTKTFGLHGSLDTDTPQDFAWTLDFGLGYFVIDGLELGAAVASSGNDLWNRYDVGLYGQYNINTGSQWVPFLFLGAYYSGVEVDDEVFNVASETDFDTAVGKLGGGLSWFLTENIALDCRILYAWANDPLWVNQDGETQDSNVEGLLGFRYYWQ